MSATPYKGGLAVGGPSFDKTKLQMRRPTPDSDVLASSDDDRDHVPAAPRPAPGYPGGRRPSSGWLQDIQPNRKFSLPSVSLAGSQPTTPAVELPQQSRPSTSSFPWNTNSFSTNQTGTRLKEVLPSPTSILPPGEKALPSPTSVEADDGIGFLLTQNNPVRKSVRSQSYSVGQADIESSAAAQFPARLRTSLRHRPSKPSLLGEPAVGLSQLREDEADEIESSSSSVQGVALPPGYWEREQKQALLKQVAVENARARNRAPSSGSPGPQQFRRTSQALRGEFALDESDDGPMEHHTNSPKHSLVRRYSEHISAFNRDSDAEGGESKKTQWASTNFQPLAMDNMGRRHSFAHYGSQTLGLQMPTLENTKEEDEEAASPLQSSQSKSPGAYEFDTSAYFTGHGPVSRAINASAISAAHPAPIRASSSVHMGNTGANPYTVPQAFGRPGRRLFVVTFKCSRADIYYLYDNTGLEIRSGDLVIVEGDRGCDLGQVREADVSLEEAKKLKTELNNEHFKWLVMFSQYSLAGSSNDSGMLGALARANNNKAAHTKLSGMGAQQDQDAKPRMIKRLAQAHEIDCLRDKEGQEAKAKRVGALKAAEHRYQMEILDAEYQADYHKLTFFYFAENYVNFNDLVVDLFKQYKVRIWMSAVNPASVVNPAGLMQVPPPSAIGPGAIIPSNSASSSLPVGPGFGNNNNNNNNMRSNDQSRARNHATQGQYNNAYYPFSNQVPNYQHQGSYQMQQWGAAQQYPSNMYARYDTFPMQNAGYPQASTSGTPINYGAFYPPPTFANAGAFNNVSSGYGGYQPNPYTSGPVSSSTYITSGSYGNGYTATSMPPQSSPFDVPVTAMQNLSFGNK